MKKNRILCLIISLVMLLGIALPANVLAEEIILEDEGYEEYYEYENVFEEEVLVEEENEIVDAAMDQNEEEIIVVEDEVEQELAEEDPVALTDETHVADESVQDQTMTDAAEAELTLVETESFSVPTVGPVITEQPEDVAGALGTDATFKVVATGSGLKYQWYFSSNNGVKWTKTSVTGCTTDTITMEITEARNGNLYRCVVTDGSGNSKTSEAAKLTISNIVDGDLVFEKIGDTNNLILVKYNGNAAAVTVPSAVNNMTVTEIDEEVFMDKTALTSIDLPNSITVIHARAFKGCTNLSTMTTH